MTAHTAGILVHWQRVLISRGNRSVALRRDRRVYGIMTASRGRRMDIGMRGVRPKRTTSPAEDRICLAYFWFSASFLNARSKIVSASNRDFRVGVLWECGARVPKRTLFRKSGLAGSPHPNSWGFFCQGSGRAPRDGSASGDFVRGWVLYAGNRDKSKSVRSLPPPGNHLDRTGFSALVEAPPIPTMVERYR